MITRVRQFHRRAFFTLGLVLPVAFVAGMLARKPIPVSETIPAALAAKENFQAVLPEKKFSFRKNLAAARLLRADNGPAIYAIEISSTKMFAAPDVLVYWTADNSPGTNALPPDAVLLGALAASPLLLPESKSGGALILYSLADSEVADVSAPLPSLNLSTK